MPKTYRLDEFKRGKMSRKGHQVYLDCTLKSLTPRKGNNETKFVLKKNKDGRPLASQLEVAFSGVTNLFLGPGLTCKQNLVKKDKDKIWGIACNHICYEINKREKATSEYYKLEDPQKNCSVSALNVKHPDDIPVYFFDKLPHGFFKKLRDDDSGLVIDYRSLANILATSYFLEEDDLHKGNFGFYIVKNQGKAEVRFFKIDHDLMFIDSIMSQAAVHFRGWTGGKHSFDITARDLLRFPYLVDSANGYWPTKQSKLIHPFQDKEYRNAEEVQAFASLGKVEEFKEAKWLALYKHILMPQELIHDALCICYDDKDPYERSQIALVESAVIARQAHMRAVLFTIPEFRDFIKKLPFETKKALVHEIAPKKSQKELRKKIRAQRDMYAKNTYGFEDGDTPLHVAIKLGEFRYEETLRMFDGFLNVENGSKKTPLDIAAIRACDQKQPIQNLSDDARLTMKYLVRSGAQKTISFEDFADEVENYEFRTDYLDRASKVASYEDLRTILTEIGEDHRYCLKFKKNLALACVKECIKSKPADLQDILLDLKKQVNAHQSKAGGLAYIRQLRSSLWIIRQIRGLYGRSSTLVEMNDLANESLVSNRDAKLRYSFFSPTGGKLPLPGKEPSPSKPKSSH